MRRALVSIVAAIVLIASSGGAPAVEPDEILQDAALEERARELSQELRCLVCQNQSIDDSNAPLARDLRILVRERLKAGDSDTEVIDFVVARYGEFVLLDPRFAYHTLVLWLAAPALLLLSILILFISHRRRNRVAKGRAAGALTPEEQNRLDKLLHDG